MRRRTDRAFPGRRPKLSPEQVAELRAWARFATSKAEARRRLGIGRTALNAYLAGSHKRKYPG